MGKASQCHTVMVKGNPVKGEYTSAAVLTVGMVCQLNSSYQLAASDVATTITPGGELVVMEAPERGKGIFSSGTVESTYAIGEQVPTIAPARGDEVLVLLTAGQIVTRGGLLEVAATGKVIAHAGSNLAAFRALESLDSTVGGSQDSLLWAQRQ
jgi:hypothetical protein